MESPCASIESKSSSHQEVAELYFPDYAAHTFAVNRSGNNAVLVVQKLLAVVDLESGAQKAFRKLNAQGGAGRDVRAVEWGPHAENANLIASAFQNQVDIWDLESERAGSPKLTLKAHTKPTYGLNWSRFDPNVIATCAADSFVYIWDLREFRKPQDKFKVTVSGASVVQWNRLNSQLLASVHDCDVRIWDRRKPTSAVGYISAHFGKVNWLDWSHEDERRLVTCSQDSSMKVWSTQQPRSPLNILKPWPQPALRALFTPFGEGMVGCCAPSLHVNADPNIWLWNSRTDSAPSYCFSGSQEATHEMKWLLPSKDKKARLATWSKVERKLRIWTVPKEVEETCRKDKSIEAELESAMSQTSLSSTVSTLPGAVGKISYTEPLPISPQRQQQQQQHSVSVGMLTSPMSVSSHSLGYSSSSLHTLEKEFSLVDADIPNVTIEDRDHAKRTCHVKCISGLKQVALVISFPSFYPNDAPPSFTINNLTSNIDQASQQSVLISLNDVAHAAVKENKPCLQLCLKKLSSLVDALQYKPDMPKASMSYPSPLNPYRKDSRVLSTFADDSIPFPRTNGARFCGNGKLIVFMRPQKLALVSVEGQKTPKSMSEVTTLKSVKIASRGPASRQPLPPSRTSSSPMVSAHAPAVPPPSKAPQATSIMPYIVKAKQSRISLGNGSSVHSDASQSNPYVGVISISNAESLLPFSLELAKSCKLTAQTIDQFCEQNKELAQRCGRPDLVRTWLLVKLATSVKNVPPPLSPDEGLPWSAHPLGRRLVESLLEHYWSLHDVQTVAILSCALQMFDALVQSVISKERGEQVLMPYEHSRPSQLPFGNPLSSVSSPGSPPMENRQMWGALAGRKSYFLHDFSFEGEEQFLDEGQEHLNNCLLLSEGMARRCAEARRSYGNILERYQLLMQKTEVLKYQPMKEPDHIGIEFSNVCQHCGHTTRGPKCHCQKMAFDCVVCHTAVRGLSNFCLRCGHGGHAIHLQNWFSLNSVCASGCGCRCLEKSLSML